MIIGAGLVVLALGVLTTTQHAQNTATRTAARLGDADQ
jgi:hypothetical protein